MAYTLIFIIFCYLLHLTFVQITGFYDSYIFMLILIIIVFIDLFNQTLRFVNSSKQYALRIYNI